MIDSHNPFKGICYYRYSWRKNELRYFKVDHETRRVLQVCAHKGEPRKGLSATLGLYEISYMTLRGSYLNPVDGKYIEAIDSLTFEEAKQMMIDKLNLI